MNDLNFIREKELHEMQRKMEEERIEVYKKNILTHVLTKSAYQRLCFVKQSHPGIAQQVEYAIVSYSQSNPNLRINEEQLKEILREIQIETIKIIN